MQMINETNPDNIEIVQAERNEPGDYYVHLDRVFSAASRFYDSKILSNFINVNIRNMELKILLKYSKDSVNILEIGCGTGEESKRFIQETGKKLQCVDIASGMVAFSSEKMKSAGLAEKFSASRMGASRISSMGKKFDLIYSFNGAFNTEPDTSSLLESLSTSMPKGAILIFSLRNSKCLGESILYTLARRSPELKKRRSEVVEVEVGDQKVSSRYYSKKEVINLFSKEFKLRALYGLGIVIPPYMAEKVKNGVMRAIISKLDLFLSRLPVLRAMGDEVAYVMERK